MAGADNSGGNGNGSDREAPLRGTIDILHQYRLVQQVEQIKELEKAMDEILDNTNSTGLMHDNTIQSIGFSVTFTHSPSEIW